jgi:hypothetical protein
MPLRHFAGLAFILVLSAQIAAVGQQGAATGPPLNIKTASPVKGYLQRRYRFEMHAEGGITPVRWRLTSGALPKGVSLTSEGVISGVPTETGEFSFAVTATDSGIPAQHLTQDFHLLIVTPLVVLWSIPPKVNGLRVDGAIKVSNQTGEDFDLTMIVLAVNEHGRATAIGYQHFPLKQNTTDFVIPFGENLTFGSYAVNVDVVGEVAATNTIFRARLATNVRILQAP